MPIDLVMSNTVEPETKVKLKPRSFDWYWSRLLFTLVAFLAIKQTTIINSSYSNRQEARARIERVIQQNPNINKDYLDNIGSDSPQQADRKDLLKFKNEMVTYESDLTDYIQSQLFTLAFLICVSLVYSHGMEITHQERFPKSKTDPK
jgi:hypothetical protein